MQIHLTQQADRVQIGLEGDLDYTTQETFVSELRHLISRSAAIDVDFSRVRFIDSSGVAALLACAEDAGRAGVTIRFCNVGMELMEIFDLIGVRDMLPFA